MKMFVGEDGKFSYTKFFAIVFHVQLGCAVGWRTYKDQTFDTDMWWLYAVLAAGHVTINKAISAVQELQKSKLSAPVVETTTTTTARGAAQ